MMRRLTKSGNLLLLIGTLVWSAEAMTLRQVLAKHDNEKRDMAHKRSGGSLSFLFYLSVHIQHQKLLTSLFNSCLSHSTSASLLHIVLLILRVVIKERG